MKRKRRPAHWQAGPFYPHITQVFGPKADAEAWYYRVVRGGIEVHVMILEGGPHFVVTVPAHIAKRTGRA